MSEQISKHIKKLIMQTDMSINVQQEIYIILVDE